VLGDETDGAVEVADHIVTRVKAREMLVLLHQNAGTQPCLLAEDDRLLRMADDLVDLGV